MVNGLSLHYVDWGGTGEAVLFLTGLGDRAHRFDALAANFVDPFRVLGLTRRGQGQSDTPVDGYDTGTLVEDIRAFLDALGIDRVNLIGHSIAGTEMTRFAGEYPSRIHRLIYLDSANDYAHLQKISVEADLKPPSEPALAAIAEGAAESSPAYEKVKAPALAFIVVYDRPIPPSPNDDEATRRYLQLLFDDNFWGKQADAFRRGMVRGLVIELHDTNHFFFQDPKQVDRVVYEMQRFLLSQ